MSDVRDVIIIGGGPAGYTAALYAARANMSPLVIEGFNWGGQLMITSDVENYPGYIDGIMGPEMMPEFRAQAGQVRRRVPDGRRHPRRLLRAPVQGLRRRRRVHGPHRDRRHRRNRTSARARVRACAPRPRRHLLRHVRRLVLPRPKVVVVGGGDSAMEEALFLAKFASKVTIVHRRDEFRASQIMIDRAAATRRSRFSPRTSSRRCSAPRAGS